ncbi:MAG: glycosyltransferase family 1 protein [Flavobacterium sp.]|nr:MAG: glycosyltransferase family 1 protein [Flavobacterium sp.]
MNALFLHNPLDLNAPIDGGVQICSQEFLNIVSIASGSVHLFEVGFSRKIAFRLLYKLNLDNYQSYDPSAYTNQLLKALAENNISHVFINKSELIRFSRSIKETFPEIKIIIMSHGNSSGDLLGDLTAKKPVFSSFLNLLGKIKLGMNLYTESWFRKRYIDFVCTMSEEENSIEKWLGINDPVFLPRLIGKGARIERNGSTNVFGYVGTLSHTPNISALYQLFDVLLNSERKFEIRIVGQPANIGRELERKYPFVRYLGSLDEDSLIKEIENWSFFINPIFNYSRGASMKLAKAIEWEIPVITTVAGKRGYKWPTSLKMIETSNSPQDFADKMLNSIEPDFDLKAVQINISEIKKTSLTAEEIGTILRERLTGV